MSSTRFPIVSLALRSYPSWWRDRYGTDAASTADDLLSEGRSPLALAGGCVVGAIRERLRGPGGSSSPINAGTRLRLSVMGTHGSWMLALPLAFLLEALLIEQARFDGRQGAVPFGLKELSVASGALAIAAFTASVWTGVRLARRSADRSTARLAALPLVSGAFCAGALGLLIGVPLALDDWRYYAVLNWTPEFLFRTPHGAPFSFQAAAGGSDTAWVLFVLTWLVIIVGTMVAVVGFSAASRRVELSPTMVGREAFLGSVATFALAVNWASLLLFAVVLSDGSRPPGYRPFPAAPPHRPPDLVFELLAVMVLPLAVGLRSSIRSLRARRELRA